MFNNKLYKPVIVFDAGIGSYDIASRVAKAFPKQDILYFADRASFPYGSKTKAQLLECIDNAIKFFLNFDPCAVILASNAPSIMVLDLIKSNYNIPIIGVKPPVAEAISLSKNKHVGILGVSSLIKSNEMQSFVSEWNDNEAKVELFEASDLVDFVENGKFILDKESTRQFVEYKMKQLPSKIDVFTLSSTHLPWLRDYFSEACPDKTFIDPANEVIDLVRPYTINGSGEMYTCASENEIYKISDFKLMLEKLAIYTHVFLQKELIEYHKN